MSHKALSFPRIEELFPMCTLEIRAAAARLPVQITGRDASGRAFSEHILIEVPNPSEVLFCSALPFETGDYFRIVDPNGGFDLSAAVISAQYRAGKTAVAARVTGPQTLPIRKA